MILVNFFPDEEEGGIFYDAFEDTESMQDYQEPEVLSTSADPKLIQYKDRLNKIHQKKANLRNKKVSDPIQTLLGLSFLFDSFIYL